MASRTEAAGRRRRILQRVAALVCAAHLMGASFVGAAPADSAGAGADSVAGVPQRDIPDLLRSVLNRRVNTEIDLKPRVGLGVTLLPSVGYNPSYGAFVGVSAAVGGWLGNPETTIPSAGSAGVSYSTTGQISVQVKTDFYTPDNGYALKGDWRYLDTNQSTYGLGPADEDQVPVPMDFVLYRFYQTALWHVPGTAMFTGIGYHFDRWDEMSVDVARVATFEEYAGEPDSRATASGVSYNVLYDTRDNPINARRGTYWIVSLRSYQKQLGSDANWQAVWSDLRVYPTIPPRSRNTLAIWNYCWFTFGDAPYLSLPATGWDTYGRGARGYLQGRIRGQNQIYTETEYRMALTRDGLLGAVGFVNLMATSVPGSGKFGPLDPGFGAGVRVKFNKHNATNLGMDLAWDRFGTAHVFFGMQEVF